MVEGTVLEDRKKRETAQRMLAQVMVYHNIYPYQGFNKSRENTWTIGYVFYFFFQLIASGTTSENGATAARIVVVDGNDDHEQSNKRPHSEENNVMDVQLRPELVIHMPVQVSLCIK